MEVGFSLVQSNQPGNRAKQEKEPQNAADLCRWGRMTEFSTKTDS